MNPINVLAFFSPWTSNRCILSSPTMADYRLSPIILTNRLLRNHLHTLVRLAELVLTLNAFSSHDQHYRKIGGVAMGSKMGPNYACLFVGYIKERIRSVYTGFVPQLHKRYIDDVGGAAQCIRLKLEDFINYVSNFHSALQFTSTISDFELPFLTLS